MHADRLALLLLFLVLPGALLADAAAQPAPIPLWPDGAPGAVGHAAADRPTLTPYLPPPGRATGAAAVVFPGGGYRQVVAGKEGADVAAWLTSMGVAAFVVEYRVGPRYRHPAMLQDARRAVRLVRARAAAWGVDPNRVAAVGFSAGGHLAGLLATADGPGDPAAADPVARRSARPDLLLLAYPVVTLRAPWAHAGSRAHLLGPAPDSALAAALSVERRVTPAAPPTFLVTGGDDAKVPVENTLMLYAALRRAGVPAELHVFASARHGFGPRPADPAVAVWTTLAAGWLRRHGWLTAALPAAPGDG